MIKPRKLPSFCRVFHLFHGPRQWDVWSTPIKTYFTEFPLNMSPCSQKLPETMAIMKQIVNNFQ